MDNLLIIISLLIFAARVLDVSLGTVRLILLSKGSRKVAPILGFFEISIWLIAVQQLFVNFDNWVYYFAYASGFAAGTYVGILLEEKISIGKVMIRVITEEDSRKLFKVLDKSMYTITTVSATGPNGKLNIIKIILDRKHIENVLKIVQDTSPDSFYSIEDVRSTKKEITIKTRNRFNVFGIFRKDK